MSFTQLVVATKGCNLLRASVGNLISSTEEMSYSSTVFIMRN